MKIPGFPIVPKNATLCRIEFIPLFRDEIMLTSKEKKDLADLLSHAVFPEDALTVDQLAGYLYGVAITPDLTQPGEWFEDIFGPDLASFDDEQEANLKFGYLVEAYNRLNNLRQSGDLHFPFELNQLTDEGLELVRDWAIGLDKALTLRASIWIPDEVMDRDEDDDDDIITSVMIILGVGHPEQIPELFENVDDQGDTEEEVWRSLINQLPLAVETLQSYAAEYEELRLSGQTDVLPPRQGRSEVAEADRLCRCGSGKEYLKCCGLN